MRSLLLFCVVAFGACVVAGHDSFPSSTTVDKVRLRDVTALHLTQGAWTTWRRTNAEPQLSCVAGPCKYAPATVSCTNVGFDGMDVLWRCQADLAAGIKLGEVQVSCEGYLYADDPDILRGSCGLRYTLTGTRTKPAKVPNPTRPVYTPTDTNASNGGLLGVVLAVTVLSLVGLAIYSMQLASNEVRRSSSRYPSPSAGRREHHHHHHHRHERIRSFPSPSAPLYFAAAPAPAVDPISVVSQPATAPSVAFGTTVRREHIITEGIVYQEEGVPSETSSSFGGTIRRGPKTRSTIATRTEGEEAQGEVGNKVKVPSTSFGSTSRR